MSLIFPYSVSTVISELSTLFSLNLSTLTDYESLMLTIFANFYFFGFWFFILFFTLKSLNWVYERLF